MMPNRFSISGFKRTGLSVWLIAAVIVALEWTAATRLPGRFYSHEVDQTLYDLDHKAYHGSVLLLGDSVGRQVGAELNKRKPEVMSLACNAAIETAGQYYLLQRFAERNPLPQRVVLMMGNPMNGNLAGDYTENFVQRCFLRWREIVELATEKKNPAFTAWMIAYKVFPSLRYRLHLQRYVPGIHAPNVYSGVLDHENPTSGLAGEKRYGLLGTLNAYLSGKGENPSIAASYFEKLVGDLDIKKVRLLFVMPPMPDASRSAFAPGGDFDRQIRQMEELSKRYPLFSVIRTNLFFPDDWFGDGTHVKQEHLSEVAEKFSEIICSAQ